MAVAIVIADRRSHARLLTAVFIKGCTCRDRHIGKGSIVIVAIEDGGSAVAGDVDIGPAVFVEVQCGYAERVVTIGASDVRLGGDILEGSVATIVIEDVLRSGEPARTAHYRDTFPETGGSVSGRRRRRQIEIHIVGDHQI